jgi:hypothetical protein
MSEAGDCGLSSQVRKTRESYIYCIGDERPDMIGCRGSAGGGDMFALCWKARDDVTSELINFTWSTRADKVVQYQAQCQSMDTVKRVAPALQQPPTSAQSLQRHLPPPASTFRPHLNLRKAAAM